MPSEPSIRPGLGGETPLPESIESSDPLECVVLGPFLVLELLDAIECRSGDHQPCLELLALLVGAVIQHAELADQPGQRQPLADHRHQDQREGDELDQVAPGQGRAGVRVQGKRQRGGERDRPSHP